MMSKKSLVGLTPVYNSDHLVVDHSESVVLGDLKQLHVLRLLHVLRRVERLLRDPLVFGRNAVTHPDL